MNRNGCEQALIDRLALFLLNMAFQDFAAAIRRNDGAAARDHFLRLEFSIATMLFRFWTETEVGRACPHVVAATAWRVRAIVREGREVGSSPGGANQSLGMEGRVSLRQSD